MARKYTKFRHRVFFKIFRPVAFLLAKSRRFRTKKFKPKKGENYLILSNHQGALDPVFLAYAVKTPIYFVANDAMFGGLGSKFVSYLFGPIRKRKGMTDVASARALYNIAKEGGTVAVFPEANRTWDGEPLYIDRSVVKLIRLLKLPVMLYNIRGGYGVDPRWSGALRRGAHTGEIVRILTPAEAAALSDDELYDAVKTALAVKDEGVYSSKKRAEYLERLLFVCPECGAMCTLKSAGSEIACSACGAKIEYGEDMTLLAGGAPYRLKTLAEWCDVQRAAVRDYAIKPGERIFIDNGVKVYDKTSKKRKLLFKRAALCLTPEELGLGDITVPTSEISSMSVFGGTGLTVNTEDKSYFIKGGDRFNPVKYMLFSNVVCEKIKQSGGDVRYAI